MKLFKRKKKQTKGIFESTMGQFGKLMDCLLPIYSVFSELIEEIEQIDLQYWRIMLWLYQKQYYFGW